MPIDALRFAMCICVFVQAGQVYAAGKAAYQPIDWNGDGTLDLVELPPQAASTDKKPDGAATTLRVYVAIPESMPPRFSPPKMVVIPGGEPAALSFADCDGDGDVDLLGCGDGQIWVWENKAGSGAAVRLDPARSVAPLAPSDIRQELSRFNPAATFQCQAIAAADWEGDGDQDLLVIMASSEGDLAVVELLERSSDSTARPATYAPPAAIRDDRGLPVISRAGSAVRSVVYMDWDRDGDLDLLFYDTTSRPSDAGGWLMFMENDNTRQKPLLLRPFTILPIAGAPFPMDWNKDGQIDLIAGGELFMNVNSDSSIHLPVELASRPGGSRRPHPWTLPRFKSSGAVLLSAGPE